MLMLFKVFKRHSSRMIFKPFKHFAFAVAAQPPLSACSVFAELALNSDLVTVQRWAIFRYVGHALVTFFFGARLNRIADVATKARPLVM